MSEAAPLRDEAEPLGLVDSHVHLDAKQFAPDREEVIARARAAGVRWMVNAGSNFASSRAGIALAEAHEGIYAAVGIHPHEADSLTEQALDEMADLLKHCKAVAVGEIGLDFYYTFSPREAQLAAFQRQLELARSADKPVIVHDRDAHVETLDILQEYARTAAGREVGALHCFSGDLAMAERVLELGFLIGVAGPVTFANAHKLPEIVGHVPLDKLLIETDCPYLAPHPRRGQRNEPANVRLVADKIAQIKGISPAEAAQATAANAARLFALRG